MDAAGYEVLYDYRSDWVHPLVLLLSVVVPVVIAAIYGRRFRGWLRLQPGGDIVIAVVAVCVAGACCVMCAGQGFSERRRVVGLLDRGEARVVEGVVTGYKPIPPQGHDSEYWKVSGVDFAVSSRQSRLVHEGMRVRVFYEDTGPTSAGPGSGRSVLRIEAEVTQ